MAGIVTVSTKPSETLTDLQQIEPNGRACYIRGRGVYRVHYPVAETTGRSRQSRQGERQADLSGGAGTPLSGGLRRAAGIDNEYGSGNVLCFVAHEEINTIGDVLDFS